MTFWADTFSFNDVSCEEYDLMLYSIGGGDNDQSDIASVVSISEENIAHRWKPFFYGATMDSKLTFEIVFGVNECRLDRDEYLSRIEIDAIATWLTGHDKYMWLEIHQDDLENIRYKCMITSLKVVNYGRIPWALEATVTCDSPFAYRYPQEYTYTIDGATQISFDNISGMNGYYYPEIEFDLSSSSATYNSVLGVIDPFTLQDINTMTLRQIDKYDVAEWDGFSIENVTDNGRTLTFEQLPAAVHKVQVSNDTCVITNDQDLNIYGNCNYKWLRFKRGINILNVKGHGTLKIKCEFPINVGG